MSTTRVPEYVNFQWFVDSKGYELAPDTRLEKFQNLMWGTPPNALDTWRKREVGTVIRRKGGRLRTYEPLRRPLIPRELAKIPRTPEGALDFVSRYGFLGLHRSTALPDEVAQTADESVADILKAADAVEHAIKDVELSIGAVARWAREERELRESGQRAEFDRNGPLRLSSGILNHYAANSNPQFRMYIGSTRSGAPTQMIQPATLLASIWWSIATEICGGAQYRACVNCGTSIYIGEGGARADKRTCSDACRKALSDRQKQSPPPRAKRKGSKR